MRRWPLGRESKKGRNCFGLLYVEFSDLDALFLKMTEERHLASAIAIGSIPPTADVEVLLQRLNQGLHTFKVDYLHLVIGTSLTKCELHMLFPHVKEGNEDGIRERIRSCTAGYTYVCFSTVQHRDHIDYVEKTEVTPLTIRVPLKSTVESHQTLTPAPRTPTQDPATLTPAPRTPTQEPTSKTAHPLVQQTWTEIRSPTTGDLLKRFQVLDGLRHGVYMRFDGSGRLVRQRQYRKGKLDGPTLRIAYGGIFPAIEYTYYECGMRTFFKETEFK